MAAAAGEALRRLPLVLVLLLVHATSLDSASAKDAPVALEAAYKERITARLSLSAEAAASHLAARLALGEGLFGGYELELGEADGSTAKWLHRCTEVDGSRDSVENCVLRQLHALTALCDASDLLARDRVVRTLVKDHIAKLSQLKKVPALGMSRSSVNNVEYFFHQKTPGGSADEVDVSPTVQASVLMAVVRCGDALGQKGHLDDAESWFYALQKVYPKSIWNQTLVSFHRSGIMWESLALVASHVGQHSSFYEDLQSYLGQFEDFLRQVWEENPDFWSFASARALSLRWHTKALKPKRRSVLRRWAQEHVDRFLGRSSKDQRSGLDGKGRETTMSDGILARIGGGVRYTCGPLQGLASLASVLSDAELLQVVLKLLEKDADRYQLGESTAGPPQLSGKVAADLQGAFFRDEDQLKMEKRHSLRVDDTAMCLIALTQVLEVLAKVQGVVVDEAVTKARAAGSGPEGETREPDAEL